jgi:hypothetical protein
MVSAYPLVDVWFSALAGTWGCRHDRDCSQQREDPPEKQVPPCTLDIGRLRVYIQTLV